MEAERGKLRFAAVALIWAVILLTIYSLTAHAQTGSGASRLDDITTAAQPRPRFLHLADRPRNIDLLVIVFRVNEWRLQRCAIENINVAEDHVN